MGVGEGDGGLYLLKNAIAAFHASPVTTPNLPFVQRLENSRADRLQTVKFCR